MIYQKGDKIPEGIAKYGKTGRLTKGVGIYETEEQKLYVDEFSREVLDSFRK